MIAVYGDKIIDTYIYGTSTRLSPEAPIPVVEYQREESMDGGAANMFRNLVSLLGDRECVFCSCTCDTLPEKIRIFSDGHYVTRLDKDTIPRWTHTYPESNMAIISDYNKGAFDTIDIGSLPKKVIVDPKGDLSKYRDMWCVKPNKKEFFQFKDSGDLISDMIYVRNSLNIEYLVVTLGQDGVAYCDETGVKFIPAESREVFDVTGAGDTFTATLAYGIYTGMSFDDSIHLANKAAGISVSHPGTYIIKKTDLFRPMVFTNGCFDILHPGHVHLINTCKRYGDVVVGLNSDASVSRLKGHHRPINNQESRKYMLESLGVKVIIFDEDTPKRLLDELKPTYVIKGGDYKKEDVVTTDGAKIILVPFQNGYSTTKIIEKVLQNAT